MLRSSNVAQGAFQAALLCSAWLCVGCNPQPACAQTPSVEPKILHSYPHDAAAFTQGLEFDGAHNYIESTGQYGESTLRRVELQSGRILAKRDLSPGYFGEGLTRVGDTLVQLTWQAGVALRYNAQTFEPLDPLPYQGEGWGLCFDGEVLWMSDGSDTLTVRDPNTFAVLRSVAVRYNDQALNQLNELECARGQVFANVWHQDWIAQIDPASGRVTRRIDAAALRIQEGRKSAGTLNGIAYRGETDTFVLTGKNWSKLFEVEIARRGGCGGGAGGGAGLPPSQPTPDQPQVDPKPAGGQPSSKARGCALMSGRGSSQLGLLIGLGWMCGLSGFRRRHAGTANRASTVAHPGQLHRH